VPVLGWNLVAFFGARGVYTVLGLGINHLWVHGMVGVVAYSMGN
jgi:hypothetical protein